MLKFLLLIYLFIYFSGQPSQNLTFEISFGECFVNASKTSSFEEYHWQVLLEEKKMEEMPLELHPQKVREKKGKQRKVRLLTHAQKWLIKTPTCRHNNTSCSI